MVLPPINISVIKDILTTLYATPNCFKVSVLIDLLANNFGWLNDSRARSKTIKVIIAIPTDGITCSNKRIDYRNRLEVS